MKKAVASVVVTAAALLLFSNVSFCQIPDTLSLPEVNVAPGDTAVLSLYLRNQSFSVGGITAKVILADSLNARFTGIERGSALVDFAYFNGPFTAGSARIVTVANLPNFDSIGPLPLGLHEIARIRIVVLDSMLIGQTLPVIFDPGVMVNVITDSSGYLTIEPITKNGGISVGSPVGIDDRGELPEDFYLGDNYPNPFNAGTIIEFSIDKPGRAVIEVYDILGSRVTQLFDEYVLPGKHSVSWAGKSANGQPLPSGVYIYALFYGGGFIAKKMSYVK